MRRWTLTLILAGTALVAVGLAPRLLQRIAAPHPVPHAVDPAVVEPIVIEHVAVEHIAIDTGTEPKPLRHPVVREVPVAPIAEVTEAPPMKRPKRRVAHEGWIPELDEQPDVDWSTVKPPIAHPPAAPVEPPPPEGYDSWQEYWETCPVCGMG